MLLRENEKWTENRHDTTIFSFFSPESEGESCTHSHRSNVHIFRPHLPQGVVREREKNFESWLVSLTPIHYMSLHLEQES